MKTLFTLGILALFCPLYTSKEPLLRPILVHAEEVIHETSTSTIQELIDLYASKYNVSPISMDRIVSCETGGTYDPKLQSFSYQNGVREDSWGLAQIHLPDWPHVSKQEAEDANFSLDFLGSHLKAGQGYFWTCFRSLKKDNRI